MIVTDLVIVIALLVFFAAWWTPKLGSQRSILVICVLAALVAGIVGFLDLRWQNAVGAAVSVLLLLGLLIGHLRRGNRGSGIPWLSGLLVSVLAALAIAPLYLFPVTDLPPPSGKFPVGTRSFELSDASRPGIFSAEDSAPRRLLIRAWYPATTISGSTPRPYFTDKEAQTTATGLGRLMGAPFLFQYLKHSMTNSHQDAPLLANAEHLPTLIYSHGYTSFAGQNTALMEELASHGYVVYSIQHSYDSSPSVFPNGDVIDMDPALVNDTQESMEMTDAQKMAFAGTTLDERYNGQLEVAKDSIAKGDRLGTQSAQVWLDDRLFVLDELQRGAVPDAVSDLVAASDFSRTGQMGMSFGGSTTGGVCMVDSRCAAAINLDGGDYHGTPFGKNIPVPFLMFYSDFKSITEFAGGDETTPLRGFNDFSYERHELAGLRDDVYRVMTKKVQHLGVSDFTLFTRNPVRALLLGSIDSGAMIQIQNDVVRGFFDTHLLKLDVGFPKTQYKKHERWLHANEISDVRDWWLAAHPKDATQQVILETPLGDIELALYPKRAPLAVEQFLRYVSKGLLENTSFYRATNRQRGDGIDVIQGGLLAHAMSAGEDAYAEPELPLAAISHETTLQTGIDNERGTIAYARLAPGTANSEFFFNIQDNPELNTGNTSRNPDGQGYTTFGRVLRGMRILEKIQSMPTDAPTPINVLKGQILNKPVKILRAYTR